MARQPLIAPVVLGLALSACAQDNTYEGAFDTPSAVAVVQPEVGGPFEEPVGLVASAIHGRIATLALKQGRFLTDDANAAFLRGTPLATGRSRHLGALAAWAPSAEQITVFAADQVFGTLIEIPWIVGVDGQGDPVEQGVLASEPQALDVDGNPISRTSLSGLTVRTGYTATERWTIALDEQGRWWVEGTRSGRQQETAQAGVPYAADDRALEFTVEGVGEPGDRFVIDTDSGAIEHDVGGVPLELATAPDQSLLAVVASDRSLGRSSLRWFDPAAGSVVATVTLPDDARPNKMAWSLDGTTLYVADLGRPAVWAVGVGAVDATEIVLPWPVVDVAPLAASDGRTLLYLIPADGRSVWLVDATTGALVDVNALQPGVQGMPFQAPVRGIEAIPQPYPWPEVDSEGIRLEGTSVAVSLYSGQVVFMKQDTGCLVPDELGPRAATKSSVGVNDFDTSFELTGLTATLARNATNDRHVLVHPCAGVAQEEDWTLTFDRDTQSWEVEGARSGVQVRRAYEDQRYISDDGSISFLVSSGSNPSQDGWVISFQIVAGVLAANGDNDRSGELDPEEPRLELPGDPVFFHYRVGPQLEGWQTADVRPFVLVAAEGRDFAARIEPPTGEIEVVWR